MIDPQQRKLSRSEVARVAAKARWSKPRSPPDTLARGVAFVIKAVVPPEAAEEHPENEYIGQTRYLMLSPDCDTKGLIIDMSPIWTPHRSLAQPFSSTAYAAAALVTYAALEGNPEPWAPLWEHARIVRLRQKGKR